MIWFCYLSARPNRTALPGKMYLYANILVRILILKYEYFFASVVARG
jgi:hypothetical protein